MRCPHRKGLILALLLLAGCGAEAPTAQQVSPASVRAERRAYDGAPPVIPHKPFGMRCIECHNERGMEVSGVGFAPPSPHESTRGMSEDSRCRQCHVEVQTSALFRESAFRGLPQDLRKGARLYSGAPPTLPHPVAMRENCLACHSGPAAREEIRCSHPERTRCLQCHAPVSTEAEFGR